MTKKLPVIMFVFSVNNIYFYRLSPKKKYIYIYIDRSVVELQYSYYFNIENVA